jgi:hypothetical protein
VGDGEARREHDGSGNATDDPRGDGQEHASPECLLVERAQRDVAASSGRSHVERRARQSPGEADEEREPGATADAEGPPQRAAFGERQAGEERRTREGKPESMARREPEPVQGSSE